MEINFQLIQEEIYDSTTQQLQQQLQNIFKYLNNPSNPNQNKAKQTRDLIESQIEERQLIHQFQALCSRHQTHPEPQPNQFIKKFQDFNLQFQQLVNEATKQENQHLKLTLPPQKIQTENSNVDQKRQTIRGSKIKKENIIIQTKKTIKKQQIKIIPKPQSILKSNKISTETKIKQSRISTKISESEKKITTQTKPIKPAVTGKKGAKKSSKRQTNDWLVQMVREQEQSKQQQKSNPPRSSIIIQPHVQINPKQISNKDSIISHESVEEQEKQIHVAFEQQKQIKSVSVQKDKLKKVQFQVKKNVIVLTQKKQLLRQQIKEQQKNKQFKINEFDKKITDIEQKNQTISATNIESKTNNQKKQTQSLEYLDKQDIPLISQQKHNSKSLHIKQQQSDHINLQNTKSTIKSSQKIHRDQFKESKTKKQIIQIQTQQIVSNIIQDKQINHNIHKLHKQQKIDFTHMIERVNDESDDQQNIQQQSEKDKGLKIGNKLDNLQKIDKSKACYSEQYWQRVRKQALVNLERVKLMKQLRQNQKQHLYTEIQIATQYKIQPLKQQLSITQQIQQQTIVEDKDSIKQQITQIKQITKSTLTRKLFQKKKPPVQKKPQQIPIKLPQIVPNYLDKYPSFNHIFNVFYNKPQTQAILDIQSLMKDLIVISGNHLNAITNNSTYKRPMFKAFDNTCMYVNDAHQLLMHAQTTNIDLKTLLTRLNIFNQNLHGRFESQPENILHYRVIKSRQQVYDIITTAFLRTKYWQQLPHGMNLKTSWNMLWSWSKPQVDFNKLLVFQKVNHFPMNKNMSRKDLLYKNLQNFKKVTKSSIGFVPITYNLPKQYSAFSTRFHQDQTTQGAMNIWIMKPIGKSRGRGIRLINNLVDLNYLDSIVVQKYLKNPLLLDGYKFDLRVYALVTSIHPLEVFVYKQGFARLSTQKYVLDPHSLKNTFIHLTNFSIQRNNRQAQNATNDGGSKITFKVLQQRLQQNKIKWSTIWEKINEIIIKSLLACSLSMPCYPSAFQLFGYDVIIDTDLNVHLIEINASPSLERTYLIDEIVKQSLIDDIMDLVDFPNFDRQECINVFNQRLVRKTPSNQLQDNIDIGRILRFAPLRKVGQLPAKLGLFQRIAPTQKSLPWQKLVNSKYNPNIKYADVWN